MRDGKRTRLWRLDGCDSGSPLPVHRAASNGGSDIRRNKFRRGARRRPPTPFSTFGKELTMFGISPLGWIHTLGSLPAIPVAAYMFARFGRIVPRSAAGAVYFFSMLIGATTVVLIAHEPVSYVIAGVTLSLLLVGYGVARLPGQGAATSYVETISLTLSAFLLMLPTITETLRRVPDGHPLVTDLKSPLLLGAQGTLFVALIVGLTAQILHLRRQKRLRRTESPWARA